MGHRRTPQADSDLDDIWYYVASKSGGLDIADRLVDSITDRFFLLASHFGLELEAGWRTISDPAEHDIHCYRHMHRMGRSSPKRAGAWMIEPLDGTCQEPGRRP